MFRLPARIESERMRGGRPGCIAHAGGTASEVEFLSWQADLVRSVSQDRASAGAFHVDDDSGWRSSDHLDLTVVRLVESKHRNQRKMVGPRLG